jgi:hypothetical protein
MGRFDALTELDKKPTSPTPPPADPPDENSPRVENEVVSLLAKKQTSKQTNMFASKPAKVLTTTQPFAL